MKLEAIQDEWDSDSEMSHDMTAETLKSPKLHNKYYRIYINETMRYENIIQEYNHLRRLKKEYYNGTLTDEEMKERGWKPFKLRVLKSEVDGYVNDDEDIKKVYLKKVLQKAKVDFLESIIKEIKQRSFNIKSIIEYERFKTGA